jgi:cupin fold WbuC family metalloprotein
MDEKIKIEHVDAAALRQLAGAAAAAPRKRSHLLLHAGHDDPVQRLLISAQPGTYIRPHMHSRHWEMLVLQSGCMDIVKYDAQGAVQSRVALDCGSPLIQMPSSQLHGCVIREADTIVLEIKPGPYEPNEFADWAPEEGHADAAEFVAWSTSAAIGQRWQRR